MTPLHHLPDDPLALKLLVQQLQGETAAAIAALERGFAERQQQQAAAHAAQLAQLKTDYEARIAAILRRYYGPRSERFDPRQLLLFADLLDAAPLDAPAIEEESGEKLQERRIRNRHKHGRRPLPERLERVPIEHDLTDAEKACPCCGERRAHVGVDVSEQLEYFPANFKVLEHRRHKYACAQCERHGDSAQMTRAARPRQAIQKGLPGPSLLAYIATSKLADHLPLYRLEKVFARQQIDIARSTMCAWLQAVGNLAAPLVATMAARVRQSRALHTDDTPVPIQSPGQKKCREGRIWCYVGDASHPYIVYDYTPNRQRAGPQAWLRDFRGWLQADAYSGYDGIYAANEVIEVACWAHARRKFYDAQDSDAQRCAQMLARIGKLYDVEREAKALDDAGRCALRRQRSAPLLQEIKSWLDTEQPHAAPHSPLSKAIQYALNQWTALNVYLTDGCLAIDNNAAERALKRVALGRKNWLFAGNDRAARTAATLWSLIASAERHGADPQAYLTSLFAKLPITPESDWEQFLPDVWAKEERAEPRLKA